jgi:hypothetical protein
VRELPRKREQKLVIHTGRLVSKPYLGITSELPVLQDRSGSRCQHQHFDYLPTIRSSGLPPRNADGIPRL